MRRHPTASEGAPAIEILACFVSLVHEDALAPTSMPKAPSVSSGGATHNTGSHLPRLNAVCLPQHLVHVARDRAARAVHWRALLCIEAHCFAVVLNRAVRPVRSEPIRELKRELRRRRLRVRRQCDADESALGERHAAGSAALDHVLLAVLLLRFGFALAFRFVLTL